MDYLALKRLLTQLFQSDADLFVLHELAELILSQPLLGTTVKTDGIESDPYAYLSVLNMHVHQVRRLFLRLLIANANIHLFLLEWQNHPSIKALAEYVLTKSSVDPASSATLQALLGPQGLQSKNHVGFVFSERLINMPVQVVPHMYRMLADEIQWANDDVSNTQSYRFSSILGFGDQRLFQLPQQCSSYCYCI